MIYRQLNSALWKGTCAGGIFSTFCAIYYGLPCTCLLYLTCGICFASYFGHCKKWQVFARLWDLAYSNTAIVATGWICGGAISQAGRYAYRVPGSGVNSEQSKLHRKEAQNFRVPRTAELDCRDNRQYLIRVPVTLKCYYGVAYGVNLSVFTDWSPVQTNGHNCGCGKILSICCAFALRHIPLCVAVCKWNAGILLIVGTRVIPFFFNLWIQSCEQRSEKGHGDF